MMMMRRQMMSLKMIVDRTMEGMMSWWNVMMMMRGAVLQAP